MKSSGKISREKLHVKVKWQKKIRKQQFVT